MPHDDREIHGPIVPQLHHAQYGHLIERCLSSPLAIRSRQTTLSFVDWAVDAAFEMLLTLYRCSDGQTCGLP
jgi:hypothetical protein